MKRRSMSRIMSSTEREIDRLRAVQTLKEKQQEEMLRTVNVLLERHGGKFHGPHVETLTMEKQAFHRFANDLISIARGDSLL